MLNFVAYFCDTKFVDRLSCVYLHSQGPCHIDYMYSKGCKQNLSNRNEDEHVTLIYSLLFVDIMSKEGPSYKLNYIKIYIYTKQYIPASSTQHQP